MFIFTLLWPFGSFVISICKYKYKNFVIASLGVAIMYALCMQTVSTDSFDSDITRNLKSVIDSQYLSWKEIFLKKDFFLGIFGKLLCYISSDIRFLTICFELISTVLFLRCIYLIEKKINKYNKMNSFIIVLLVFTFSFWDINSLRFKIATIFYVLCVLEYFFNNKYIYKYVSLFTPFIHFGYFIAVIPLFLYSWLKDKTKTVWIIFIISFFLATPSVAVFINNVSTEYMSESISETVSIYSSEEGLQNMEEVYVQGMQQGNQNRAISRIMVVVRNYIAILCIMLVSLFYNKYKKEEVNIIRMLNFLLLFCSFANIVNSNSQGQRFYGVLVILTVCFLLLVNIQSFNKNKSLLNINVLIKFFFVVATVNGLLYLYIGRNASNLGSIILGNFIM